MTKQSAGTEHSPGKWQVLDAMGKKFVATPAYEGHPYFGHTRFVDIAGDEDYPLRDADLALIASAPRLRDDREGLLRALREIRAAACGEEQVAEDDTGGLQWIFRKSEKAIADAEREP